MHFGHSALAGHSGNCSLAGAGAVLGKGEGGIRRRDRARAGQVLSRFMAYARGFVCGVAAAGARGAAVLATCLAIKYNQFDCLLVCRAGNVILSFY